jgi:hypothetical protein
VLFYSWQIPPKVSDRLVFFKLYATVRTCSLFIFVLFGYKTLTSRAPYSKEKKY